MKYTLRLLPLHETFTMTIQLTITETPTLRSSELTAFCEQAEAEGISPEEKLARLIRATLSPVSSEPAKKELA